MSQSVQRFKFDDMITVEREVNDMVILAFLLLIIMTFLFNLRSLGPLLLFIGTVFLGVSNLSFLFNCSASTVVMWTLLSIGLMLILMYGCITEKQEQKEL